MKLPRLITRRRLKWMLTLATLVIAMIYALSLVHARKFRHVWGDGWAVSLWIMRGRVEVAVEDVRLLPRDEPFRNLFDPEPVREADLFCVLADWSNEYYLPSPLSQPHRNPRIRTKPNPRFSLQRGDQPLLGRGSGWVYVAVPLWFPLLLIAAPTAWLWYTDRRAWPWQCAKCRYDLRGLDGGVCPECGAAGCGLRW